jgi:hypothetical protein
LEVLDVKANNGKTGAGKAKWTIMLYIVADDGLVNFAIESLKQLRDTAGDGVVVAVQFDGDAIHKTRDVHRYIFTTKGSPDKSIRENEVERLPASMDMTDPDTLSTFVNWVYGRADCDAEKYCLILWGHGPELLLEIPASFQEKRLYLTPEQLRQALEGTQKKVNSIGFDACSMSMVEVAHELKDLAGFMVASQDEVPDMSLPYNTLLQLFRSSTMPLDAQAFWKNTITAYADAYQDYFPNSETLSQPVTISCLQLQEITTITNTLRKLVQFIVTSAPDKHLRQAILQARKHAQGFVGGLFVDIYSFCEQLRVSIDTLPEKIHPELVASCDSVLRAIGSSDPGAKAKACIVGNYNSGRSGCHGLSVYFPYLRDDDRARIEEPFVKGGLDTVGKGGLDTIGKGGLDTIGKGATDTTARAGLTLLYATRWKMIEEIEAYYKDLRFSQETGWYDFIQSVWSPILAEMEPGTLDVTYSAEQCAKNLFADEAEKAVGTGAGR